MKISAVKFGIFLLAVQIAMLALTMGFHAGMDKAAEQAGIMDIIKNK